MITSLQKWQSIVQDPRVVLFFTDMFERLGVRIVDTKEEFTCILRGDNVEFEPSLDEKNVDFTIEIQSFQVDRFAEHAKTGELNLPEQYRIIRTFFSPATAATQKNPVVTNPILRALSGIEDLIHVYLKSPTPDEPDCEDANHTLIFINRQWLVIPGLYGTPKRIFHLNMSDALAYHKKVFAALKANTTGGWYSYWRWYLSWRKTVSSKP